MMLKTPPGPMLCKLLQALNALWRGAQFPSAWKEAFVVPVLKQGKAGNTASDYRPISLTSCLCERFEKMVCSRLSWFLERSRLLNPVQCGFRRGHSTIDHLVTIDTRVPEFRAVTMSGHIFLYRKGI